MTDKAIIICLENKKKHVGFGVWYRSCHFCHSNRVYPHPGKTQQMCQKTRNRCVKTPILTDYLSYLFLLFWHVYNFLLKSFEDKLWLNKKFLYVFSFQIKNRNKIWIRTLFESSVNLEESLIAQITSLILLTCF